MAASARGQQRTVVMAVIGLTAVTTLAAACGDPLPRSASSSRVSVRDSAGVALVEVADLRTARLPAWALSDAPMLDIGARLSRGPGRPARIFSATRFSDGRLIIVGDRGAPALYDITGAYLGTFCDAMSAGALRSVRPARIEWAARFTGDSLYAYDATSRQLVVIDPAGRVHRRARLDLAGSAAAPEPVGVLPDGRVVARPGSRVAARVDRGLGASLHDEPSTQVASGDAVSGQAISERPPTERAIRLAVEVAYSRPSATNWPDGVALTLFDTTGIPVRRIRSARAHHDPLSFGRKGLLQPLSVIAPAAPEVGDWKPRPGEEPAAEVIGVRIGVGGEYWVPDAPVGAERRAWTIYTAHGRPIARVAMSTDFDLLEVGADYILGRIRDADGEERVRLYALDRGASADPSLLTGVTAQAPQPGSARPTARSPGPKRLARRTS